MPQDSVLLEEKAKAKAVIDQLFKYRSLISDALSFMGDENLKKLKDLRDNAETNPTDLLLFMEQLHAQNQAFDFKDKIKRLEELKFLLNEPYFSRLDLSGHGTSSETIYIGKFGFTPDNTSRPVVTDWRAKIASIYYKYRYPQKNVSYETQDGPVTSDLKLKRTFEFDSGSLVKYYNNDIQLDEREIVSSKIAKRSGGVLEDIIATIQESQMAIIEEDPRGVCVVQGCVGSGKSTVAIHKLSHIFFNYPKLITAENSLLVAKSQILVGYLSTLFPKLGIFDINYGTLKDLLVRISYRHDFGVSYELDDESSMENTGIELVTKIESEFVKLKEFVQEGITKLSEDPLFSSYFSFVYDTDLSANENVNLVLSDLEEEIDYQNERIKDGVSDVYEVRCKENIKNIKALISKLRGISRSLKTSAFPKVLKEFHIDLTKKMGYKDALIYSTLYSKTFGLSNFKKFEYCVVDEGQDYSLLEYLFLNELVIKGRFTILGDLNQGYVDSGITCWEDIKDVISESRNFKKHELTTNYRSTKQIIDYACNIISKYSNSYLPNSIERSGAKVEEVNCTSDSEMYNNFVSSIVKDINTLDKSIGIICFDDKIYNKISDYISTNFKDKLQDRYIELKPKDRILYTPKGVYLTKFENCKGLEFSKVYVLSMPLNFKTPKEAKSAYVAVTRAMNELVVYKKND